MRRIMKLTVLALAAATAGACNDLTEVVRTESVPTAGVRFINAVPDTGAVDFRFVDIVENSSHFNMPFRSGQTTSGGVVAAIRVQYKATRAGQRTYKIFANPGCTASACNQALASVVLAEGTLALEAGKNYTVLLQGYAHPTGAGRPANAPAMQVVFYEEDVAAPGADVAVRVINTAEYAIDARQYVNGGTAPATADWANVAPMSRSAYLTRAPAQLRVNVRNAGAATNLFTDPLALIGAAEIVGPPGPFDAIPGTNVAGSAVSAIVFPRSVAGTAAANFTTPGAAFVWDRRPPRTPVDMKHEDFAK